MNSASLLLGALLVVTLALGNNSSGFGQVEDTTKAVRNFLCDILPLVVFLAVIFAALLYGISQVLPSEQKARVGQFAGAALVTGVLAAIVYAIGPAILGQLIPNKASEFVCP
ncbi:MAG: hypothetical protein QXH89_00510 [Candidatus Anstonellales archaeon]